MEMLASAVTQFIASDYPSCYCPTVGSCSSSSCQNNELWLSVMLLVMNVVHKRNYRPHHLLPYHRICLRDDMHSEVMTIAFARSLKRSKQLRQASTKLSSVHPITNAAIGSNVHGQVFSGHTFDMPRVMQAIIDIKHINKDVEKLAVVNMKLCLNSLNFVNAVCERIRGLVSTAFDANNRDHVGLLDSVWDSLRPNTRRRPLVGPNYSAIASVDWGEIGFQGIAALNNATILL
jgi:hypothetical protein